MKGSDHKRQVDRLKQHVVKQGYLVLDREPTDEERLKHARIAKIVTRPGGYNAERTPMDLRFHSLWLRLCNPLRQRRSCDSQLQVGAFVDHHGKFEDGDDHGSDGELRQQPTRRE